MDLTELAFCAVDARWFGGSTVPASSFAVQDCSMFKLQNGRSVNVFSSTQKLTCQVCLKDGEIGISFIFSVKKLDFISNFMLS